jgi:hypothetical protein
VNARKFGNLAHAPVVRTSMGRVLIAGFTAALVLLATVLIYLVRGPPTTGERPDQG